MIDTSLDRDTELGDRQAAITEARLKYRPAANAALSPRRGRLTAAEAAARKAMAQSDGTLEVEVRETVPAKPVEPADPSATMRHARLGFFAALALALLLIWIVQRRKESGR